jgi:DNA-directed RNA polymerase specialized sigma24 family protein
MDSSETNDDDRLSPEEVDAHLRAFTPVDWAKARSLGRMAAAGLVGWSGDDLLVEALTRLQEGRRVWRRGVHPLVTLKTIMRSIAHGEFKKQKNGPIDEHAVVDGDQQNESDGETAPAAVAVAEGTPEQAADSRSQLEFVEKLVADDEECGLLVQLWADGGRGKEAAAELGWDAKKYDTVRQRLLRRIEPLQNLRKQS